MMSSATETRTLQRFATCREISISSTGPAHSRFVTHHAEPEGGTDPSARSPPSPNADKASGVDRNSASLITRSRQKMNVATPTQAGRIETGARVGVPLQSNLAIISCFVKGVKLSMSRPLAARTGRMCSGTSLLLR